MSTPTNDLEPLGALPLHPSTSSSQTAIRARPSTYPTSRSTAVSAYQSSSSGKVHPQQAVVQEQQNQDARLSSATQTFHRSHSGASDNATETTDEIDGDLDADYEDGQAGEITEGGGGGDNEFVVCGSGGARQRIAKACECCRTRRIKCSGDIPCKPCREAGAASACVVRVKARPNRPITARQSRKPSSSLRDINGLNRPAGGPLPGPPSRPHPVLAPPLQGYSSQALGLASLPDQEQTSSQARTQPPPPDPGLDLAYDHCAVDQCDSSTSYSQTHHVDSLDRLAAIAVEPASTRLSLLPSPAPPLPPPRFTPIRLIEGKLANWCSAHDIPLASLVFQDETRLSALHASPLPPPSAIEAFEDELMRQLIITNDLEQASSLDRLQIVTLYNRYRIFPTALTADQKAMVYAALCLARHAMMRSFVVTGAPTEESQTREDVTYFRMACECLAQWSFPSVHALWALVCLVPYSQAHGGLGENRELLRMMAWQVRELGLHRTDMGKLYLSGEMSLFPLFRYMDTFLAGLDDLHPFFTLAESDVDLSAFTQLLTPVQQTVSDHAARFHDDFNDPNVDITSDDYVFLAESRWIPSLAQLQSGKEHTPRDKRGWSEIRYYWLRIMLYIQRTAFEPVRANHAWIVVSHCVAQVVYIHHELALKGSLNPSWPQLRRFSICGQLLVICSSRYLYQPRQATELFEKLLFLFEAHRSTWAGAGELLRGYKQAAAVLGLTVHSMSPSAVLSLSLPPQRNDITDPLFSLSDYAFPFDPTLFFAPTADMETILTLPLAPDLQDPDSSISRAAPLPLPATGLLTVMGQTTGHPGMA